MDMEQSKGFTRTATNLSKGNRVTVPNAKGSLPRELASALISRTYPKSAINGGKGAKALTPYHAPENQSLREGN